MKEMPKKKRAKRAAETLDAFDKESLKAQLEKTLPRIATEMSDLLERPVPRITKRNRKDLSEKISWGVDISAPHLERLELALSCANQKPSTT